MKDKITLRASRVKQKRKIVKFAKLTLLALSLLLTGAYVVVSIVYNSGNFSITMDKNLYLKNNIIIYDNPDYKIFRTELYANTIDTFDNISYKWLPSDIDNYDGSHNGDNYIAYSFYIENLGDKTTDYWSEIVIDDVIKHVDDAVRIRVYKNGTPTTYAKLSKNGTPEKESVPFESDSLIAMDHIKDFKPGDKNKYTVVLWLEGSDPECNDNILGGEIKIHMDFNSQFIEK